MNKNTSLVRAAHIADLRPLLVGFKLSDRERQGLVTLRSQLEDLETELAKVSIPVVGRGLKSARCAMRAGAGPETLQSALRTSADHREIRRGLKSRNAELGRQAGRLLEPIFRRAVDTARPRVAKLRADAVERITRFLPTADADQLAAVDVVVAGVEAAVELVEAHARSCVDSQAVDGRWRVAAETLDRLLASLGEKISDAAKAST